MFYSMNQINTKMYWKFRCPTKISNPNPPNMHPMNCFLKNKQCDVFFLSFRVDTTFTEHDCNLFTNWYTLIQIYKWMFNYNKHYFKTKPIKKCSNKSREILNRKQWASQLQLIIVFFFVSIFLLMLFRLPPN